MEKQKRPEIEIILGVVAPIGCNKEDFFKLLESAFELKGYKFVPINAVELLKITPSLSSHPKSLQYFAKMQICSELRTRNKGILLLPVVEKIVKKRKEQSDSDKQQDKKCKVVYLIDQLKNTTEYKVLSHIYGLNYIQISLFSNYDRRNGFLEKAFKNDGGRLKALSDKTLVINCEGIDLRKSIPVKIENYRKEILPDASSALINKDFADITEEFKENDAGQEVSKLFHKSHYFFNLDEGIGSTKLENEIKKFVDLIEGEYRQYPTQDEFGMNLASQAKFRSNFPGDRQIGAAILSENGEVISVASIRAPSSSANPTYEDEIKIKLGYKKIYSEVKEWDKFLKETEGNPECSTNKSSISQLRKFVKESLEYHPCTHAEIAAILDAAKLGLSVRDAILYITTFPCHICAKDIITAGIQRVVYLAAYPKSKNKELYPELIILDNAPNRCSNGVPFEAYMGISPKRFSYVYDLDNKPWKNNKKEDKKEGKSNIFPPLLKCEIPTYYELREKDVIRYLKKDLKGERDSSLSHLKDLI